MSDTEKETKLILELYKEEVALRKLKKSEKEKGNWTQIHENLFQLTLRTLNVHGKLIVSKDNL